MNDEYVYPETVPAPKFEYTLFHNRYGLDFEEGHCQRKLAGLSSPLAIGT